MKVEFVRIAPWLALLAGACSPSDFDDFAGRPGPGDGAVVTPDASSRASDGGAATSDAATEADAGTTQPSADAGALAQGGASCAVGSGAVTCSDDFESGGLGSDDDPRPPVWAFMERWGRDVSPSPTGKIVVAGAGSRRFESAIGLVPGRRESARLMFNPERLFTRVHVEFDFAPVTTLGDSGGNDIDVVRIQQAAEGADGQQHFPGVSLAVNRNGTFVRAKNQTVGGSVQVLDEPVGSPVSTPVRVAVDVVLGPAGSVRVAISDRSVQVFPAALESRNVSDVYVLLGLYTEGTTNATAHYDNVSISYVYPE